MVFSAGNPEADFMLVGEAPGFQEEQKREPFVGPAGEKLNQILKAMGLAREKVYIYQCLQIPACHPEPNHQQPQAFS